MGHMYRIAVAAAVAAALLPLGVAMARAEDPAMQFVDGVQAGLLDGAGIVSGLGGRTGMLLADRSDLGNAAGVLEYCLERKAAAGGSRLGAPRDELADDFAGSGQGILGGRVANNGWRAPASGMAAAATSRICATVIKSARPML
jgi:hypothetical protein